MVPLAALLAEEGHRVTGSDRDLYPPMSTSSNRLQIPVARGLCARSRPARLRLRRRRKRGAPRQRRGGRGRAARAACPLPATGRAPAPPARKNLRRHHGHARQDDDLGPDGLAAPRLGPRPGLPRRRRDEEPRAAAIAGAEGPHFVLEGDEYNAAFFDRGPKFLHYEPRHLFVGNIEYDHADLYPGPRRGRRSLPRRSSRSCRPKASIVANADDARVAEVLSRGPRADRRGSRSSDAGRGLLGARRRSRTRRERDFTLLEAGLPSRRLSSPLIGPHNLRNALGRDRARARPRPLGRGDRRARCRASRACGGGSRSRARRTASSSWTTSRTTRPPSPARSPRRARAGRAAGSGRSSSRARTPPAARSSRRTTPRRSPHADAARHRVRSSTRSA